MQDLREKRVMRRRQKEVEWVERVSLVKEVKAIRMS